jgi:hypothetical protein
MSLIQLLLIENLLNAFLVLFPNAFSVIYLQFQWSQWLLEWRSNSYLTFAEFLYLGCNIFFSASFCITFLTDGNTVSTNKQSLSDSFYYVWPSGQKLSIYLYPLIPYRLIELLLLPDNRILRKTDTQKETDEQTLRIEKNTVQTSNKRWTRDKTKMSESTQQRDITVILTKNSAP